MDKKIRLNIIIPKKLAEEMKDKINEGRYETQSEYVRTALRQQLNKSR